MDRYFRVMHPMDSCPPERRHPRTGALPQVEVMFGGDVVAVLPEGASKILPEHLASHALKKFPWLEMQPVEATFAENLPEQPVQQAQHRCPFCPDVFSDFGLFSAHVTEHATAGVNSQPAVSDAASLRQVDQMAQQGADRRGDVLKQAPALGGGRR